MTGQDKPMSTIGAERRQQGENTNTLCCKSQSDKDSEMEVKADVNHTKDGCLCATQTLQQVLSAPPAKPRLSFGMERSLKDLPSCRFCNLTFMTNFFFESHMKRHHNQEYWKIMDEKRRKSNPVLPLKASSTKSDSAIGEGLFKCEECGNSYLRRRSLLRHRRIHSGEKPFKCDECDKGFSERHSLRNHKRTHTGEKPFKCIECGKLYRNSSSLYAHMRSHQGLRPYLCNECGKNFRTTTDINAHMRTHTGEKPFKCEECGKDFTQRAHLNTHMLIHTGEKPFKCEECGQSFNRNGHLQRHMTKHTRERPFLCSLCGRGFSNSIVLRRHMKIHSLDRSAMCMQCGKTFRTSGDLRKHTRCHRTKPFSCQVCCKNFINGANLIAHMKRHGIQEPLGNEGTLEVKAL